MSKIKILHIIKKKDAVYPLELIKKQARSHSVAVLLIQEAAGMDIPDLQVPFFVLSDDLGAGQQTSYRQIAYAEMLDLVYEADTVMVW